MMKIGAYCKGAAGDWYALWHTSSVFAFVSRLPAALPDVLTAGVFLLTWIAPAQLGVEQIGRLMTVMLIEFFVVHSSGFYAVILAMTDTSRTKRALAMLGLAALYSMFMLVF